MIKASSVVRLEGQIKAIKASNMQCDLFLDGWVTERDAVKIREKYWPSEGSAKTRRETITRWRIDGKIPAVHLHGVLWLVREKDMREMPPPKKGRPYFDEVSDQEKYLDQEQRRIVDLPSLFN